jgi:hypothetical protein
MGTCMALGEAAGREAAGETEGGRMKAEGGRLKTEGGRLKTEGERGKDA